MSRDIPAPWLRLREQCGGAAVALSDGPPRELLELCAGLPEAVAEGDQHVGFTIRGRRFAWYLHDHHGDGRIALVFKAPPGINRQLVADDPDRFFIPAYVGPRGWAGAWLDVAVIDWDRLAVLMTDSYRLVAPKRLIDQLDPTV